MISIQKATPADAKLIADIGIKTLLESHGNSAPAGDIAAYVSMTYDLKKVVEELEDQDNIFHIIYANGQAAGYSKILFNTPHPLVKSLAITKLERIYLLSEFYDMKLGSALFDHISRLSKEKNQTGIWLFTWTENQRALAFYKKKGFKIIGNSDFKISETHSNPNYVMYLKY